MYYKLDKNLKKEAKIKFLETEAGQITITQTKRAKLLALLLLVYGALIYFTNKDGSVELFTLIISIAFLVLVFVSSYIIFVQNINKFLKKD